MSLSGGSTRGRGNKPIRDTDFLEGQASQDEFSDEEYAAETIGHEDSHTIMSLSDALAWQGNDPKKIIAKASWRELFPNSSPDIVRYVEDDDWDAMQMKQIEENSNLLDQRIKEILGPHIETLERKKRQLVYKDDYVNECYDKWHKELEYVAERMLLSDDVISKLDIIDLPEFPKLASLRVSISLFLAEHGNDETNCLIGRYHADMGGAQFEQLVASMFQDADAEVKFTSVTGDQGADLIVEFASRTIAVQCKRSSSSVGNKAVQEAAAGRAFYETLDAWVVSDAQFTRSARQLAESLSVELVNYEEIPARLQRFFLTYGPSSL